MNQSIPPNVNSLARSEEALRDEHRMLQQLSDRLHAAKDVPALFSVAEDLRDALASHFGREEHPGGFYDSLNLCVPQHREDLARLVEDHRHMLAALWQLCERARQPKARLEDLQKEAEQFIKDLQHHEQYEHKVADEALPKESITNSSC
jgi:hypothetical protein